MPAGSSNKSLPDIASQFFYQKAKKLLDFGPMEVFKLA